MSADAKKFLKQMQDLGINSIDFNYYLNLDERTRIRDPQTQKEVLEFLRF
jgi:hypothetical protein